MDIIIENDGLNGISNYEPLKAWALEETEKYNGLVVQENDISFAKDDTAELRKIAKQASDLRIAIKKQHESKIDKVISQLKEITEIFENAADAIAVQVKSFEQKAKDEKKLSIQNYYYDTAEDVSSVVPFERIFDPKWLNKGSSIDSIKESIDKTVETVRNGVRIIQGMQIEFESEMLATFFETLDMTKALEKKTRLEEQQERLNRLKKADSAEEKKDETVSQIVTPIEKETIEEDVVVPVDVRLFMNSKQKAAFRQFVNEHGIKYTKVPR